MWDDKFWLEMGESRDGGWFCNWGNGKFLKSL